MSRIAEPTLFVGILERMSVVISALYRDQMHANFEDGRRTIVLVGDRPVLPCTGFFKTYSLIKEAKRAWCAM